MTGLVSVGAGAALTAACARVSFRLAGDVPVTGQTFGVLVVGGVLGPGAGAASQTAYLAAGAAGLPVFAEGEGRERLTGPTGGFLWSFPLAAWVTGRLARSPVAAATAGTLIPFAVGVPWLALHRGLTAREAVAAGVTPFVLGGIAKGVAAAAVIRRLRS
jgi:biotin transport system substrate-specific component